MRSVLSTIHQTLTPESSSVLNHSISEATRRRHSQTTPLHVASSLLSTSHPLRQACLSSHPDHPLHSRALPLCFSVALDRLPSSTGASSPPLTSPPPLSNALLAALKRAQALQRRSSPDHPHQPLLSVKVDLHHLTLSILDDPSVSRVMREAHFSSPLVKASLNPSTLTATPGNTTGNDTGASPLLSIRHVSNSTRPIKEGEVKRVMNVLTSGARRSPILVGDSGVEAVAKEVLKKVEQTLESVRVVRLVTGDEETLEGVVRRMRELGDSIETQLEDGIVIDVGDLKWLVGDLKQQREKLVSETGRAAVLEMGGLVQRFRNGDDQKKTKRVWIVGSASCATYLRCQVYHPTMESDWDLQAVPIAPRAPLPSLFPSRGILSSSVESLTPSRTLPSIVPMLPKRPLPTDNKNMCLACTSSYERELTKLVAEQFEKSFSNCSRLPQWLQAAKVNSSDPKQIKEHDGQWKQKTEELMGRWKDTCAHLHPKPTLITPSLARSLCPVPTTNPRLLTVPALAEQHVSAPRSPIGTELALGPSEHSPKLRVVSDVQEKVNGHSGDLGGDLFKKVYKGLSECVMWQHEAALSVALAVEGCRLGGTRLSVIGRTTNDMWLLFVGPDKVGKRRMAAALSKSVFGSGAKDKMTRMSLAESEDGNWDKRFWGRAALSQIAEAVRQNPFMVFLLEDIDRADALVQGSIRRAVETGRLPDMRGQEVALGGAIFVLTSSFVPDNFKASTEDTGICEERILEDASNQRCELELIVQGKEFKRRKKCYDDGGHTLSLDLNLAMGGLEDNPADSSRNSSEITVELEDAHGHDHRKLAIKARPPSLPHDLVEAMSKTIVFKQVDFTSLKQMVADVITGKFESVMGREQGIEVDCNALNWLVGGVWFGAMSATDGLKEWVERVMGPCFWQLKNRGLAEDPDSVVKLVGVVDQDGSGEIGGWPGGVSIMNSV